MINKLFIKNAVAQGIVPGCSSDPTNCGQEDIYILLGNIYEFLIGIGIIATTFFFMWGAFILVTSSGSPDRISQGKRAMTNAVVGLLIVLTSYIIVNTFLEIFTSCSGWTGFSC